MVIVDTQFLFALRKGDSHHSTVEKILKERPSSMKFEVPSAALIELLLVLKSQGKEAIIIQETLKLLEKVFMQENINVLPSNPLEIAEGVQLNAVTEGSLFDALIASAVLIRKGELIADDKFFEMIPKLKVHTLSDFLKQLSTQQNV